MKKKLLYQLFSFILLLVLFAPSLSWATFDYSPMENIPGFEGVKEFPAYVVAIYKFGIWTIGICALLMIMIGGFMYITSAGNNAAMGTAKKYITDAIIGLILAMTSWILLYAINPDLVKAPNLK